MEAIFKKVEDYEWMSLAKRKTFETEEFRKVNSR